MISPETSPASTAPRRTPAQSSRKRTTITFATLLLSTVFVLAGAPAAEAAPAFADNQVMATVDPPPPCRGDTPGVCPLYAQSPQPAPTEETSTNQLSIPQL